jgi:hypothetical protein
MASVPKGKRGAAAVVVTSEGQRVEANVLNKQGEVVGREVLTHTPNKSFIVPDSESSSRVVNDVWHRLVPIGVSADDQAAIRKHNGQQNRDARKRRRGDPEAAAEMEAAATRTLEEKAAEDRAKEEKAAENRAKDAARKREARQAGKADVHKVQPRVDPTPLSPARAKVPSSPPSHPAPVARDYSHPAATRGRESVGRVHGAVRGEEGKRRVPRAPAGRSPGCVCG